MAHINPANLHCGIKGFLPLSNRNLLDEPAQMMGGLADGLACRYAPAPPQRDTFFRQGFGVLRFSNYEIDRDLEKC